MIQSGDGDWIIDSVPPGMISSISRKAFMQKRLSMLKRQRAFCLVGNLPAKQKNSLLRVLSDSVVKNLSWT